MLILQKETEAILRDVNKIRVIYSISGLEEKDFNTNSIQQDSFYKNISYAFNILVDEKTSRLMTRIQYQKEFLSHYCSDIIEGIVAHKHLIKDKELNNTYPLLEGKDIKRYFVGVARNNIIWDKSKIHRPRPDYLWDAREKIIIQRISGGCSPIVAALDKRRYRTFASINNLLLKEEYKDYYRYILALLNSKVLNYYYAGNFTNNSMLTVNISKTFLEKLPIPQISTEEMGKINGIVDQILTITDDKQYLKDFNKQEKVRRYECEIDKMVYKIYNLTHEDIILIGNAFNK